MNHVSQETATTCQHCGRVIIFDDEDGWVDPEATGDDRTWRETCDANDTFTAKHEPTPRITARGATEAIARESPEAAGLMALVIESQAAMTAAMLPTWDTVDRTREKAYQQGFDDGYAKARDEIYARIFGGWDG